MREKLVFQLEHVKLFLKEKKKTYKNNLKNSVGRRSSGKGKMLDLLGKGMTSWAKIPLPTPQP